MNPTPAPVVLLVENDPVWAELLATVLRQEGATVLGPAATAAQARALCAGPGPAPTLAVLDIGLEDGLGLGQWLRQRGPLPLLYLTGLEQPGLFEQARATAPLAFVAKSCQPTELRHHLVLALDAARGLAAPAPLLLLPGATGQERVLVADIAFVKVRARHCWLHTATARYVWAQPLAKVLALLQPNGFRRVHRNYLLNLAHLRSLDKRCRTLVAGTATLPLGNSFRAALLRELPRLG
ncbi:response regulator transcription factor [Hymenobacter sp. ASUV-10]|uniref:Response regulator transcription factor n=1 Tax=Hymenobacter aranciens TaxID=3063996 RepID=A0ABT9BH84_9BACT|nr:response regulator transcription factor [Hymenobacter sp. ASUV-10]MDO7877624.1 response regulator transcription factor [Hymenobacter sp. ASUV-10]